MPAAVSPVSTNRTRSRHDRLRAETRRHVRRSNVDHGPAGGVSPRPRVPERASRPPVPQPEGQRRRPGQGCRRGRPGRCSRCGEAICVEPNFRPDVKPAVVVGTRQSPLSEKVHWRTWNCPPKHHGMTFSLGMRSDVAVALEWLSGCHRPRVSGVPLGRAPLLFRHSDP